MPEHTPAPIPSRAVYGFILNLTSKILFKVYLIWALVPESWFRSVGITCLPHRYWAVVIPIFLLTVLGLFAFVIYPSLGLIMTPSFDNIRTIKDKHSESRNFKYNCDFKNCQIHMTGCYCNSKQNCRKSNFDHRDVKEYDIRKIPKLQDLNIIDVSRDLYLKIK